MDWVSQDKLKNFLQKESFSKMKTWSCGNCHVVEGENPAHNKNVGHKKQQLKVL